MSDEFLHMCEDERLRGHERAAADTQRRGVLPVKGFKAEKKLPQFRRKILRPLHTAVCAERAALAHEKEGIVCDRSAAVKASLIALLEPCGSECLKDGGKSGHARIAGLKRRQDMRQTVKKSFV